MSDKHSSHVFRIVTTNGTERVILASSWNTSASDGTMVFRDDLDRIIASLALDLVDTMYLLKDGPVVWADGRSYSETLS